MSKEDLKWYDSKFDDWSMGRSDKPDYDRFEKLRAVKNGIRSDDFFGDGDTKYGNVMRVFVNMRRPLRHTCVDVITDWHLSAYASDKGKDGPIIDGGDEIVAFYPSQIKSATDNNGKFDSNDPDIRN